MNEFQSRVQRNTVPEGSFMWYSTPRAGLRFISDAPDRVDSTPGCFPRLDGESLVGSATIERSGSPPHNQPKQPTTAIFLTSPFIHPPALWTRPERILFQLLFVAAKLPMVATVAVTHPRRFPTIRRPRSLFRQVQARPRQI